VTDRLWNYYAARTLGGTGPIMIESGQLHSRGRGGTQCMGLYKNRLIPGLKERVDLISYPSLFHFIQFLLIYPLKKYKEKNK